VIHGQVSLAGAAANATAGVRAAATPAIEAKKVKVFVKSFIKVFRVGEGLFCDSATGSRFEHNEMSELALVLANRLRL
jgi:hypothetical protein